MFVNPFMVYAFGSILRLNDGSLHNLIQMVSDLTINVFGRVHRASVCRFHVILLQIDMSPLRCLITVLLIICFSRDVSQMK